MTTKNGMQLRRALSRVLQENGLDPALCVHLEKLASALQQPSPLQKSLIQLVEQDNVPLAAAARILRQSGYDNRLIREIETLLDRRDEDPAPESQLQKTLSQLATTGTLTPAAVVRLLRQADYDSAVVSLVEKLLDLRKDGQQTGTDLSGRDLARLLGQADDTTFAVLRARRGKSDDQALRGSITAILHAHGVDATTANDLASAILHARSEGFLPDYARIGRRSQSAEDGLVSIADTSWREEEGFRAAYRDAQALAAWGRDIKWRVHTLVRMARLASDKSGDFVECGVDTGGTARAVMSYLGDAAFADRRFFLFDTFRGLVRDQLTEQEKQSSLITDARYPDVLARVRENFAAKPFVRIVPGPVPDTLSEFDGEAVAYLHIDMNVSLPEVEALKFFWPKLSPGAPVIFDDYGFPHHHPQRQALDAAARDLGVEIMMLPTCQGLLFKP